MLRTVVVTAATLAAAVVLAACGGSSGPNNNNNSNSSNSGSAGSSGSSAAFRAAELKVSQCIRAHGVPNYPDPGSSGEMQSQSSGSVTVNGVKLDATAQTLQNAQKACAKYAPQAPAVSASKLASIKQGAVKMAECMRKNGVPNFADPSVTTGPGGHGVGISIGAVGKGNIDIYSPAFKAARTKCSKYIPKPRH